MTRESFYDPEQQAPSEATKRDFAYFIDVLSERGVEIEGQHFDHTGIYVFSDQREATVNYRPDDGTPVDDAKGIDPVVASVEIKEPGIGKNIRTTYIELAKSGNMRRTVREFDPAVSDARFKERLRAHIEGDVATVESIKKELKRQQEERIKRIEGEEELGTNIPTEADVEAVNEIFRTLVQKLREERGS